MTDRDDVDTRITQRQAADLLGAWDKSEKPMDAALETTRSYLEATMTEGFYKSWTIDTMRKHIRRLRAATMLSPE
jgi:hypothetical protein